MGATDRHAVPLSLRQAWRQAIEDSEAAYEAVREAPAGRARAEAWAVYVAATDREEAAAKAWAESL